MCQSVAALLIRPVDLQLRTSADGPLSFKFCCCCSQSCFSQDETNKLILLTLINLSRAMISQAEECDSVIFQVKMSMLNLAVFYVKWLKF